MAPTGRKGVILFVHGFGSSAKCWKPLLQLLAADDRITARYDLTTWEYPTRWVELNLLGRIPRLQEIGRSLADEIDSPEYHGRELTLVGHSQGGLAIQSFIADALTKREAFRLRNIRQAVFFATPTEGSTTALNLRLFVSTFFNNPQEATLRVLNPDVADMRAIIRQNVVAATTDDDGARRIPIHAFCGMQDNLVPEASARGVFDSIKTVPGTHFSIIQPADTKDPRYREFVELLLDPGGHSHRFEVESYRTVVTVEPREKQTLQTANPRNSRVVEFDNYATVKRTVRFTPSNRCRDRYTIKYDTRNDGYVVAHTSHANEAPPSELGRWEDTGTYCRFDFSPSPGDDFCLNVEIYRGFGAGERNVHFHLGTHSHYRKMIYLLDLSAYVRAGGVVTTGPYLYLEPSDVGHSALCKQRKARDPLGIAAETPDGVYTWEFGDIEQGVVDIIWDVAMPSPEPAAPAALPA